MSVIELPVPQKRIDNSFLTPPSIIQGKPKPYFPQKVCKNGKRFIAHPVHRVIFLLQISTTLRLY